MKKHSNQREEVYFRLRERIATGELAPGDVMSEAALAKEFGLSRTPIGEALRRLDHEGLVDQIPRYGTVVRKISVQELEELFEIRAALEGMAAAKATAHITQEVLAELRLLCQAIEDEIRHNEASGNRLLEHESLRRFLGADMSFHMGIIVSAGNKRLCQVIEHTRSLSLMFAAQRGVHSLKRVQAANQAHVAIVSALEQRDGEEARRLVVEHIETSRIQSLQDSSASKQPARMNSLNLPDFLRYNSNVSK